MRAAIIVAHGSRDPLANQEVIKMANWFRERALADLVLTGYYELARPDVVTAITHAVHAGAREIVVIPFFLLLGNHVQEDLPTEIEKVNKIFPEVSISQAGFIGFHPILLEVLKDRITELQHAFS